MTQPNEYMANIAVDQGVDPLMDHLSIFGAPTFLDDGAAIELRLEPFHMNGGGSAHGGLFMVLLDVVMACSTLDGELSCVTVELKSNFMRPGGVAGDLIKARGFLRSRGKSLAFCDGEIRSESGELLATASGTFKYIKRPQTVDKNPVCS